MSRGGEVRARPALRALVELRLRLLWRGLQGRAGVPDLVARVVTLALALPAGAVCGIGAGAAAYSAVRRGHGLPVAVAVGGLYFGVWVAWTAMALSTADREALDLRRYLAYPLPPGRVYAYGLVASILGDPFALFWSLILAGAFAGAAVARPGPWLLLLAAGHLAFAVATAGSVALLQELGARLLRGRRVREVAVVAIYLSLALLVAWGSTRGAAALGPALQAARALRWLALPAALAAEAGEALYQRETLAAVPWLLALAGVGAAAAWGAFRLALAEALSGSDGAGSRAGGARAGKGWRLPGRIGPIFRRARLGPLVEKELKYVLRHPLSGVLAVLVPAFAGFVGWRVAVSAPSRWSELASVLPLLAFALYAHLVTQVFWLNALGADRGGVRLWFLAPVELADVLRAKNLAAATLALVLFAGSASAIGATVGAPPLWAGAAAVALHVGIGPWFHAAGNLVSTLHPRAMPRTMQRGGWLPPLSGLVGMAILGAGAALFGVPVLLAVTLDAPWLLAPAWAALGAAGLVAHRASLAPVARLLASRREQVIDGVAGDEG